MEIDYRILDIPAQTAASK